MLPMQWPCKAGSTVFNVTFMRLSTASLTAWTGRARSGMAFPSSASSWRITSLETWRQKRKVYETRRDVLSIYWGTSALGPGVVSFTDPPVLTWHQPIYFSYLAVVSGTRP